MTRAAARYDQRHSELDDAAFRVDRAEQEWSRHGAPPSIDGRVNSTARGKAHLVMSDTSQRVCDLAIFALVKEFLFKTSIPLDPSRVFRRLGGRAPGSRGSLARRAVSERMTAGGR